jgi:hypothetical protein
MPQWKILVDFSQKFFKHGLHDCLIPVSVQGCSQGGKEYSDAGVHAVR